MSKARDALSGRVVAVLNTGSGSCNASSENEARQILDAAGLASAEIVIAGPPEIERALQSAAGRADVLVVLGRDGTIGSAAALCGSGGALLAPLPGGTMNLLPRALYGAGDWRSALRPP